MLIRGDKLNNEQRKEVLAAYGYRWTVENAARCLQWMEAGRMIQPGDRDVTAVSQTDAAWLASHYFEVTKRGELSRKSIGAVPV